MDQTEQVEANRLALTKLEWGVILSLLLSAGSVVFSAGVIWTTVQSHDDDIVLLKQAQANNTDRLARIETKIDIVVMREQGKEED